MKYKDNYRDKYNLHLNTDITTGLSEKEAKNRLKKHGMNIIFDNRKSSPSRVLFKLFYDPVSILLLVCSLVMFTYKAIFGSLLVLFVWLSHNIITLLIYYKSDQILSTVKSYGIPKCKVRRDGKTFVIDSRLLVPGDIVLIEAGDIICADCNIISSKDLYVYEFDVTGREDLVKKSISDDTDVIHLSDMHGMLFASSSVVSGNAVAQVTATSQHTEIVSSAGLIDIVGRHQPDVLYEIKKKCRALGIISIAIALILFLLKIITSSSNIFEAFLIVVALIASSMSETLLPLTQIAGAINIYNAATNKNGHSVIIKNAGAIDDLVDLDVFVITDEFAEVDNIDIKSELDRIPAKTFICSDKLKAFSLASANGLAVYRDINEFLSSDEKLCVFVVNTPSEKVSLIERLKAAQKSVGVLTSRLDCIRMLDIADVAFTYAHINYKTNKKSKIIVDAIRVKQNQILSRISDVLCEKSPGCISKALECAVSVFDTISESAIYLMTTQIFRCILAFCCVLFDVSVIRYSDILIGGMLVDLCVVLSLCYIDRSQLSNTRPKIISTAVVNTILLFLSAIFVTSVCNVLSDYINVSYHYANVSFISIVAYSMYTVVRLCTKNGLKNNLKTFMFALTLFILFITSLFVVFDYGINFTTLIISAAIILSFELFSVLFNILFKFVQASGEKNEKSRDRR